MDKNTGVVVTTERRGVFFGYLVEEIGDGQTVILTDCRNVLFWDSSMHGFLGLAAQGPSSECRVGPQVPQSTLLGVTSITKCTAAAIAAWESEPWK